MVIEEIWQNFKILYHIPGPSPSGRKSGKVPGKVLGKTSKTGEQDSGSRGWQSCFGHIHQIKIYMPNLETQGKLNKKKYLLSHK